MNVGVEDQNNVGDGEAGLEDTQNIKFATQCEDTKFFGRHSEWDSSKMVCGWSKLNLTSSSLALMVSGYDCFCFGATMVRPSSDFILATGWHGGGYKGMIYLWCSWRKNSVGRGSGGADRNAWLVLRNDDVTQ